MNFQHPILVWVSEGHDLYKPGDENFHAVSQEGCVLDSYLFDQLTVKMYRQTSIVLSV